MITILITGFVFLPLAYAQGTQSAGGVDVDGSWYLGEGLKKGNYFEYRLCELDLNDCAPIIMKLWFKGDVKKGTETLWDTQVVVLDGDKIIKGYFEMGKITPEPISESDNLFEYSLAFKSSIAWLSAFATSATEDRIHGPQEFRSVAWGKIGAIGGSQLIPKRAETITVPAGTFDTIVVGWYSGNENEMWLVDDFPFPVKGLAWAWVTTGIAPVMFRYELLEYEENVETDPFVDVIPTVDEKEALGCPTDFYNYVSESKSTNTFSMQIQYNYSPEHPKTGCEIDWKINFKNKYNENQFETQVHFDIWTVDENGNKLRSYAEEQGRKEIFNGFGLAHIRLPVKEPPGLAHYAIFIYGTGPQNIVPDSKTAGYVIIDIEIDENENIPNQVDGDGVSVSIEIPDWVRNNAGWWADGQIDDNSFVQGIQWLIQQGIMKIPSTSTGTVTGSNEIPSWIKNNAGWWADGQIDDNSFVQGIQWLIQQGILKIA